MQHKQRQRAIYEIEIVGPVGDRFLELFPDVRTSASNSHTVLRGPIADGAQLVAVVDRLVASNITLVRLERVGFTQGGG